MDHKRTSSLVLRDSYYLLPATDAENYFGTKSEFSTAMFKSLSARLVRIEKRHRTCMYG